jgi:hypothetical protein
MPRDLGRKSAKPEGRTLYQLCEALGFDWLLPLNDALALVRQ